MKAEPFIVDKTYNDFGYLPTDLARWSHKLVWVKCPRCGIEKTTKRWIVGIGWVCKPCSSSQHRTKDGMRHSGKIPRDPVSSSFFAPETCPQCGRKSLYTRRHPYLLDMAEKHCKYCRYRISLMPPKDPATEAAELRQMARELNDFLDNFMEKWRIPNANHVPRLPRADRELPGTEPELPKRYTEAERHAALRI
jgi:RNA polymerase subunit RPABC4/transcription elongation factor Spt4